MWGKRGGSEARIPTKEVCLPCVWRERKRKIRCMMERRAKPERHDAAYRKSGGSEVRGLVQGGRLVLDVVLAEGNGSCK